MEQPLFELSVNEGRIGALVIGGLNPIATIEEIGASVGSWALAGIIKYERFFRFTEMDDRIRELRGLCSSVTIVKGLTSLRSRWPTDEFQGQEVWGASNMEKSF